MLTVKSMKKLLYGIFESDYNADASSVTLFSLTKHVKNVLPIFADAILHPVFPEREMHSFVQFKKQIWAAT